MFNKVNKNLPYRSIRAIDDPEVISFLNQINKKTNLKKILENKEITKTFFKRILKWIKSTKLNNLKNLKQFKYLFLQLVQVKFLIFIPKHKKRNFRAFKGDMLIIFFLEK